MKINFKESEDGANAEGALSQLTLVAFNARVQSASSSVTVYNHASQYGRIGRFDQLVLQAKTNHVSAGVGPIQLAVDIEHSADGIHWMPKFASPPISEALNASGPTYPALGIDDGSTLSLALVRLAITLSAAGGPVSGRVKIVATCNDYREQQFAKEAEHFRAEHDASDIYYLCYPTGTPISPESFKKEQVYTLIKMGLASTAGPGGTIMFVSGATCCFRADGEFIVTKGKNLLYASVND